MNNNNITNCTENDIPIILKMYEQARELMAIKNQVIWPDFPTSMIQNEITEKQLWCLKIENEMACIWTTAFNDPIIWGEKDKDPSVYIHKIATEAKFRGNNFVKILVDWTKNYAAKNKKQFIRLDTVGLNHGLINHYEKQGFKFLGASKLLSTDGLPDHYKKGKVCFFEIKL